MRNVRWALIAGMTVGLVIFYFEYLKHRIAWEGATGYFLFGMSIIAWHVVEQLRGEQ